MKPLRNFAGTPLRIACFYADDGMIGARDDTWLHTSIGVLAELFDRVGLKTNTTRTEAMTCTPSTIQGYMSLEAYWPNRGVAGSDTFKERKHRRVECAECGTDLAAGSLAHHMMRSRHGTVLQSVYDAVGPVPSSYRVSFPKTMRQRLCPVEGCSGRALSGDLLRRHFVHRHPEDTLCILEEGLEPLPECELCRMHVTPNAFRTGHQASLLCKRGVARVRQWEAIEVTRRANEQVFTVYGAPLKSVATFKYLGRPLTFNDDDWPALYRNLSRPP
jgi:hypothetical protein